ncbi:MBL fold metallo-hydrolase [Roseovarius atlanticus]|uniref:MBL fold metallo-hydrolase n=1 Tax=Roseovarius atlanticus TaxID=1641875 RepID=UPI001C97AE12|nr:MBL fold metallo-hydrolase [Roseovarius atlanticus]MBY5990257.1 MBL fold metallo-hydrolase [Roseovarius atlanticus]MBY6126803.1 MBL fold metallo-hydrolase [Roseovarius atlanticus]MBY6151296.1 MBL fold metallo-hydrolase [Roseovarius atlanticus]
MSPPLSRRGFIASATALSAASALPAWATAPMLGAATPPFRRFTLGGFEVTTLLAGEATRPDPHSIFGLNVDHEEFTAVSEAAMIPTDQAQFFFTPTVVNTGSELVLFDTGLNAEGTTAALEAAGYSADMIDTVVITHMHGDHIGGLMDGDTPTFANAGYVTGSAEFDHWSAAGDDNFEAKVRPLAEQFTMIGDGDAGFSGHTAMAAFGHTPGHMVHLIESEGESLMIAADFANHYVWSLAHPDWEVKFDMDKAAAAQTRKTLLDMLAAEKMPFVGYHMPWPATGYVEKSDSGYAYVPSSYQLRL